MLSKLEAVERKNSAEGQKVTGLGRGQFQFQPITFVDSVVPSSPVTRLYNKCYCLMLITIVVELIISQLKYFS